MPAAVSRLPDGVAKLPPLAALPASVVRVDPTAAPRELYEVYETESGGDGVRLHLHEGQVRAFYSRARFTAMVAGTQSGKTSYGPWHLWSRITGVDAPELGFHLDPLGPGTYLAVTATYDLFKLKMLPEMLSVFEHVLKVGRYWAGDKVLELKEPPPAEPGGGGYADWAGGEFRAARSDDPRAWGRIILRSAEAQGGLESATANMAWLDECGQPSFTLYAWEAVLRRLSLRRGPVFMSTTPYMSGGWLKTEIVDPARNGDPDIKMVRVPSLVNPQFPREEYEDRKKKMHPLRFAMMYEGKLVRMAGLIYPDFNAETMTLSPAEFRLTIDAYNWTVVGGIDFGWHHPFAAILLARSPSGVVYVLKTRRVSECLLADHAAELLSWEHELGEDFRIAWYADPSGKTQIEELKALGLFIEPANNDVMAGIDQVTEIVRSPGRFWLYGPHPDFVEESDGYVWETREDVHLDKPKKILDDLMDAWRYGIMGLMSYVRPAGRGSGRETAAQGTGTVQNVRERARAATSRTGSATDIRRRVMGR